VSTRVFPAPRAADATISWASQHAGYITRIGTSSPGSMTNQISDSLIPFFFSLQLSLTVCDNGTDSLDIVCVLMVLLEFKPIAHQS
jgi:hypothetical protein